jgi:predicted DNA-binding transcriptional regulator YafY
VLKVATKEELCQISLTGLRALILFGLLVKEPQSLEDIRKTFLQHNVIDESSSNDILRIDLNTLRVMGCKITRADKSTNFKYRLLEHPFSLNITDEEIGVIRRAYKKIKEEADIPTLIQYDDLFRKISNYITDETIKEKILGISVLKSYKSEFLNELITDCQNNSILTLEYKSPASKNSKIIEIAVRKIIFQNDKIYLWGNDINSGEGLSLHVKRIIKIILRKSNEGGFPGAKPVCVRFLLSNFGLSGLDDSETIIERRDDGKYLIEGNYHNKFYAVQRILSLGSACTVTEPAEFRADIIAILKEMRNMYNG